MGYLLPFYSKCYPRRNELNTLILAIPTTRLNLYSQSAGARAKFAIPTREPTNTPLDASGYVTLVHVSDTTHSHVPGPSDPFMCET